MIAKSPFFKEFLAVKASDFQKKYPGEYQGHCASFSAELDSLIATLARETSALVQMKLARDKEMQKPM